MRTLLDEMTVVKYYNFVAKAAGGQSVTDEYSRFFLYQYIEILINGISARKFGSQGQQRSASLSLKLGEAEIIKDLKGEHPVILLDDVMSELDSTRQNYILNKMTGKQVFITCCEKETVSRLCAGKVFKIENGKVVD